MPYGLPKKINTPANNAKIERCVAENVAKGTDKTLAIRICKASIMGTTKHKKKK
ncbi:hypothetical protein HZA85_01380 [Candidatus Uhrbacteria bacterium]|nr:hypothetical protein [Candidatus Uhrbacteria bacterium]